MARRGAEQRWVAFLRGMNLGNRRITNEELRAATEACGCRDVATHQASGNVVLVDDRGEQRLSAALEEGLSAGLGYAVPVFLRSAAEVRAIAEAAPFTADQMAGVGGKPQVVLLAAAPSTAVAAEATALFAPEDHVVVGDRELYWLPAAGLADNALDLRRLDVVTGGTTIRTHGTVQRLAARYL